MDSWKGKVALVTGASAGIGAALVKELVKHGMKVVGCARNVDRIKVHFFILYHGLVLDGFNPDRSLQARGWDGVQFMGVGEERRLGTYIPRPGTTSARDALAESLTGESGEVFPVRCDLRVEAEILAMFKQIDERYGRLDICVNNAGLAFPAELLDGDTEAWKEMWEVNVLALCICTRESVKLMDKAGVTGGYILHISSMSGHRSTNPSINFYTMTKHAVKAHTEGLRRELRERNSNIRITAISPGNIATEFVDRMYKSSPPESFKETFKWLEAQDIVDACIYALSCPPHTQVHDILMRPTCQAT